MPVLGITFQYIIALIVIVLMTAVSLLMILFCFLRLYSIIKKSEIGGTKEERFIFGSACVFLIFFLFFYLITMWLPSSTFGLITSTASVLGRPELCGMMVVNMAGDTFENPDSTQVCLTNYAREHGDLGVCFSPVFRAYLSPYECAFAAMDGGARNCESIPEMVMGEEERYYRQDVSFYDIAFADFAGLRHDCYRRIAFEDSDPSKCNMIRETYFVEKAACIMDVIRKTKNNESCGVLGSYGSRFCYLTSNAIGATCKKYSYGSYGCEYPLCSQEISFDYCDPPYCTYDEHSYSDRISYFLDSVLPCLKEYYQSSNDTQNYEMLLELPLWRE